jgi:pimeloyl-ACP methyl ester carboxylesterase
LFNVARNPVSKHHTTQIRDLCHRVNDMTLSSKHRPAVNYPSHNAPIPHFVEAILTYASEPMPDAVAPMRFDTKGPAIDAAALAARVAQLRIGAPIVIMIHGYKYAPGHPDDCPHDHILSATPRVTDRRVISWPQHLGLDGRQAMGIAFGWAAHGSAWASYAQAAVAGRSLARLLDALRGYGHQVHIIAHSMGARVALQALPHLAPGAVDRMILLAAAELRRPARRALASPGAMGVEFVNITTRENDLYDMYLEWGIGACLDTALGQGLPRAPGGWLDLQIDQTATLETLAALGHPIAPRQTRICHWSPYLRRGVFPLYRALLTGQLSVSALQARLPTKADRRWSALLQPPLPPAGNPA